MVLGLSGLLIERGRDIIKLVSFLYFYQLIKTLYIMDIDYTVGEVELSYKPKFKSLHKVASSEDAYRYLLPTYKEGTICYKEYLKSCS